MSLGVALDFQKSVSLLPACGQNVSSQLLLQYCPCLSVCIKLSDHLPLPSEGWSERTSSQAISHDYFFSPPS